MLTILENVLFSKDLINIMIQLEDYEKVLQKMKEILKDEEKHLKEMEEFKKKYEDLFKEPVDQKNVIEVKIIDDFTGDYLRDKSLD